MFIQPQKVCLSRPPARLQRSILAALPLVLAGLSLLITPAKTYAFSDPFAPKGEQCGSIRNKTGAEVMGTIETGADRSNFRIAEGNSIKVCSKGPFIDGDKVRVTVRSLIPLADCKTRLSGFIDITKEEDDEGLQHIKISCH